MWPHRRRSGPHPQRYGGFMSPGVRMDPCVPRDPMDPYVPAVKRRRGPPKAPEVSPPRPVRTGSAQFVRELRGRTFPRWAAHIETGPIETGSYGCYRRAPGCPGGGWAPGWSLWGGVVCRVLQNPYGPTIGSVGAPPPIGTPRRSHVGPLQEL